MGMWDAGMAGWRAERRVPKVGRRWNGLAIGQTAQMISVCLVQSMKMANSSSASGECPSPNARSAARGAWCLSLLACKFSSKFGIAGVDLCRLYAHR